MAIEQLWSRLRADLSTEFEMYRGRLSTLSVEQKADRTLLTEADIAIQALIVDRIRDLDPLSPIIAEEDDAQAAPYSHGVPRRFWVIDPIDGTSEFVRPDRKDFCSVVCLVEDGYPAAAFVYAPELVLGQSLYLTVDAVKAEVRVNGATVAPKEVFNPSGSVSVTRSDSGPPATFDAALERAGYRTKKKATSQTLDLIRTCIDLDSLLGLDQAPQFDLFWREDQKLWDGLAGLCLAQALGLSCVDASGRPRLPVTTKELSQAEPSFDCTIVGEHEVVRWFLNLL